MRTYNFKPDSTTKKLTLRRIRDICSWKVFEIGKTYHNNDMIQDMVIDQDGTITGTILGTGEQQHYDEVVGTIMELFVPRPRKECRTSFSLLNGTRRCTCPYSQVGVCSHVAALLIRAAKMGEMVTDDALTLRGISDMRTTLPYRKNADRVLAEASDVKSAEVNLGKILEMAESCDDEGDLTEAILVYVGISESLLSGLDYPAYSGHFRLFHDTLPWNAPESTREPEGMDLMRVNKFIDVLGLMQRTMSYSRMLHEQKVPCIAALHRMYLETIPWTPSIYYSLYLGILCKTDKDYEFLRRLHDPVVPADTPDPKENLTGFQTAMRLAGFQGEIYSRLKDYSLLDYYAKHYRDDPYTCARYIKCLREMRRDSEKVEAEGKRLFPDTDVWNTKY